MLKLTIKRIDQSVYWVENFNDQASLDKWLAIEMTRPYWDPTFTTETEDMNPPPNDEQIAAIKLNKIRYQRDLLLQQTDYLMMSDYPLDQSKKSAILSYRQALRDLPQQEGLDLDSPVYPTKGW